MATDVDVQYFSHLNGLTLGNNWGDLIRLLDKTLVTGIDFTQITAASIDAQGDVHITLYAAHNAMLFQVVELTGFAPASFNQKYRIKGVPSATELILKPQTAIVETNITTVGAGKLASLGYEIIFRDQNDVKRVYRAKNPRSEHPFIRVDESLTSPDGTTGVYTSTYAKYAMVGLLEQMEHIDDFENPNVLQLPFDPGDPAKNWKITGTGTSVVRGWSKLFWACSYNNGDSPSNASSPSAGNRAFTLCGDLDAFYLITTQTAAQNKKKVYGVGLFESTTPSEVVPNWFLMTTVSDAFNFGWNIPGYFPLMYNANVSQFFCPRYTPAEFLSAHVVANPIIPNFGTGTGRYDGLSASFLQIPFSDNQGKLRGTLKHLGYNCNSHDSQSNARPVLAHTSMYVRETVNMVNGGTGDGSVYLYLGELE
ncbi:hypothetical protein [Acinetobacter indicus]|uniref:hypothetical protein n=1 Tax=Acinetobacter indicus TaxID=756892 RepID=UPI002575806C|nr:hypothetical protein [Acinetobacter indicus]MDM1272600.1 hypothetical protein [Acinetobacter indicus]